MRRTLERANNDEGIVRITAAGLLNLMPCLGRFDGWPDVALLDLVIGFIASAPPAELPPLIERARAEYREIVNHERDFAEERMTTPQRGKITVPSEWLPR